MTVDTETVTTVPQNVVGGAGAKDERAGTVAGAAGGRSGGDGPTGGSVKLKPSSETIRPKKEKKKVVRKAPSMTAGAGSSKVDIFAAKVAHAVDEADSSDSEETFVYESNPPEPLPRPANHRYHSRTPSATSMASQVVDPHGVGGGGRYDAKAHNSIVGKKSMKFANANLNGYAGEGSESATTPGVTAANTLANGGGGSGTVRQNSTGTALHHHHIGRHGRNGHHPTVLDQEALFAADRGVSTPSRGAFIAGPRSAASTKSRQSPFLHSPRMPGHLRIPGSAKSTGGVPYELEADDERTPLLPPSRSPRTRHSRRPAHSQGAWRGWEPQSPYYASSARPPRRGWWQRACGCALLGATAVLLVVAVVVALVFCSKPLLRVHIHDIRNVLASDREIIFDLNVHATNPNLVAIQVSDADLLVHAKSKYVGTSRFWREHGNGGGGKEHAPRLDDGGVVVNATDNVDHGTDPIDDEDPHVMLLGQISEFDAPLLFDASPVLHHEGASLGEVRLARPGNQTETGGSDRWEEVIQHPFELIVQGVVRYSIPISSRVRSATVKGRVRVYPDEEDGEDGEGGHNDGNDLHDGNRERDRGGGGEVQASRVRRSARGFRGIKLVFTA